MLISKIAPSPGALDEYPLPSESRRCLAESILNGAENTVFLLLPLSHGLSPLCLFQLWNLKEGRFTDYIGRNIFQNLLR